MARKYTRDNRGRFASGGSGATARGGRLKTAAGNKRAGQTMKAAGGGGDGVIRGRTARTVAGQKVMGKLAKRPEPAKAAPKAAPQRIEGPMRTGGTRSRLSGRKMSEGAGKRGKAREERQAAMAGMRQMLGRVKPAQSAEPLSTGGTLRSRASLTRARAKAGAEGASSAQRGAATRANTYAKASVQRNTVRMKGGGMAGTIAKPAGLKPRPAKPAAPAKAKAAPKAVAAAKGRKAKIDDAKVSRVIGRVNGVVRGADEKTGVKRLNATQVGVRAKSFLARKEGGSVGMLNQKSQPEAFASVRKAMTKPPKYSTQTPNRNKPGRFNDLGQDKARVKAKLEARTARDRIRDGNAAAKAKSNKAKPSRLLGRREIYGGTMGAPGDAKGPRIKGTIAKPRAPKAALSSTVARTRKQAGNYQRARTRDRLAQVKYMQAASRGMGRPSKPFFVAKQLKRNDTGMRQLSLTGSAKTLYKFKRK